MKPATIASGGPVINLGRCADLLDSTAVHYDQPVGQRHRLDLVVGDEDAGRLQALMQAADLDPHLHAQLGIEIGERLVEEKNARLADHRAAHGDALALAARERSRLAIEKLVEPQRLGDLAMRSVRSRLLHPCHLQRIADIFGHRHMRIERVVLEDHGAAALARLQLVDDPPANGDLAGGDLLEAGDEPQKR